MSGFINDAHITSNATIGLHEKRGGSEYKCNKSLSVLDCETMDNRAQDDYILRLSFIPPEDGEDEELPGFSPIEPGGGREASFAQTPAPPSVRRGQARRALTFVSPSPSRFVAPSGRTGKPTKLTLLAPEKIDLNDERIQSFRIRNMSIRPQLFPIPEIDAASIVAAQSTGPVINVPVIFIHVRMPQDEGQGIVIEYVMNGFDNVRPGTGYIIKIRAVSDMRYSWLAPKDQFAFLEHMEGDGELRTTFPQPPTPKMDTRQFLFELIYYQEDWKLSITGDPKNFGSFDKVKVVLKKTISTVFKMNETVDYTFYLLERDTTNNIGCQMYDSKTTLMDPKNAN